MKVFVDLDSTINLLTDKWLQAIHRELGERIPLDEVAHWDRLADKKYQELLKVPGFFRDLGIATGAQQALQMAHGSGHEVFILTAGAPWNYADKDAWVQEYLPFIGYRNLILATCKGECAGPGKLLIDDGPHNLTDWEAAGGIAIAYDQPWNRAWQGLRMNSWHELVHILGRQATA